jgi:hypothetical protein
VLKRGPSAVAGVLVCEERRGGLAKEGAGEPAVAERCEAEVIDQVAGGEARMRVAAASHELGELVAGRVAAAEEGVELAEQVSDVAQGADGEGEGFRLCRFFRPVLPGLRFRSSVPLVRSALSGCMEHGCDQELDVAVVETGESVLEINGYPVGQACCDPQHSLLAVAPEQGRLAPRAVIAAGQSMVAISGPPARPRPTWTNWLVKSARCSQDPAMRSSAAASGQ